MHFHGVINGWILLEEKEKFLNTDKNYWEYTNYFDKLLELQMIKI
jgi:hypothetical protein